MRLPKRKNNIKTNAHCGTKIYENIVKQTQAEEKEEEEHPSQNTQNTPTQHTNTDSQTTTKMSQNIELTIEFFGLKKDHVEHEFYQWRSSVSPE